MAAPSHPRAPMYGFDMDPIVARQPVHYVQDETWSRTAAGTQSGAPLTHEQQMIAAHELGLRNRQRGGDTAMAGDAKKDDHGHAIPAWITNFVIVVVIGAIGLITIQYFVNNMDRVVNPERAALVDLRTSIDELKAENQRLRTGGSTGGGATTGGGTRVTGGGVPRGAITGGRVASPEEIARRVRHKQTFTAVPCIDGYVKNPDNNQCDLVEWIPGPIPE